MHYKHVGYLKCLLLHVNTLCQMLTASTTAFAKADLSMKKIEQRTGYGAKRVRRSE